MGWFVIVEKYHNICAGSGDTLQNFVKYGNSQHKVTKTSLLTPTVCQQPEVCWKMSSFVNIANLQLHKDFCEHWEYKCHHIPVTNETDILI